MVDISHETPYETDRRLRAMIAEAELVVLDGEWAYREAPADEPPTLGMDVLAVVRDEHSWSWLAPAGEDAPERFGLVSFHFPAGTDNSGFVGWLATELKQRLGTGVFVVCGQDSARGGIYDYWGYPASLATEAVSVVRELRDGRAA